MCLIPRSESRTVSQSCPKENGNSVWIGWGKYNKARPSVQTKFSC